MANQAKKIKLDPAQEELKSAPRPDAGGSSGSKVGLIANHYSIHLNERRLETATQYRVDIEDHDRGEKQAPEGKSQRPKRTNRDMEREKNRKVWQKFCETHKDEFTQPNGSPIPMVYDSQAMALIGSDYRIDGSKERSYTVSDVASLKPGKPSRSYTLTLRRVGTVGSVSDAVRQGPINSQDKKNLSMNSVAAVDLVLRQHMNNHDAFLPSAQAFYDSSSSSVMDIGGGKILRKGFTASAKPVQSSSGRFDLSLNADVAHTAFYASIPLTQVVVNVLGRQGQPPARLDQNLQKRVQAELKNYRVETVDGFPKKSFKTRGLTSSSAITTKFEDQDANSTTVQQYFRDKYSMDLKYPEWPLAICKVGGKQLTYPLEVLRVVPNQRVSNNNLDEKQLAQIIRHAASKPHVRRESVHQMITSSGYGVDRLCRDFGISLDLKMVNVPGRKIDAPQMEYLNKRFLTPNNGAWDVRSVQFVRPAPALNKWCYLVCMNEQAVNRGSLDRFTTAFAEQAKRLGLTVAKHCDVLYAPAGPQVKEAFDRIAQEPDMQLVVVILPNKRSPIYGDIKTLGDVVTGVLTQCISKQNLDAVLGPHGAAQNLRNIVISGDIKTLGDVVTGVLTQCISKQNLDAVLGPRGAAQNLRNIVISGDIKTLGDVVTGVLTQCISKQNLDAVLGPRGAAQNLRNIVISGDIKTLGDVVTGVLTQCISKQNLDAVLGPRGAAQNLRNIVISGDIKTLGDVVTGVLTQCISKQNLDAVLGPRGAAQNLRNIVISGDIKTLGDVVTGVLTQCISKQNLDAVLGPRGAAQNLQNIAQKVNQKLGGGNSRVKDVDSVAAKFLYSATLHIGADVTHPGPGSSMPSIAAAVGNLDSHPTQFQAQVRVQDSRQEIVGDLKNMTRKLLIGYFKTTGQKPESIIFYRDGVAEGQFKEVLQKELQAIRDACAELEDNYCPKVSFIVVQKRHHTRFFMAQPDPKARNPNVQPGTVVDRSVTHATDFSFFLCSHQGIQGTTRPTSYHVLFDENKLSSDDAQKLTHQLCHLYGRCARSVSIPAPCYYAHHAAARARHHIKMEAFEGSASSGSSGQDKGALQKAATVAVKLSKSMYFL